MRFNRNWGPKDEQDDRVGILEEELDSDAISEDWYWLQVSDEEL